MEKRKLFVHPVVEVVNFDAKDVITASNTSSLIPMLPGGLVDGGNFEGH